MILAHFISKARCYLFGHPRRRAIMNQEGIKVLKCKVCGMEWVGKVRKPKAQR